MIKKSNQFRKYLNVNNIESRKFWKPMHLQKPYKSCLKTSMKNTEYIWNKVITLPSGTGLNNRDLNKIANVIKKFNF